MPEQLLKNWQEVAKFRNAMSQMAQGTYKDQGDLIDYTLYDTAQLLSTVLEHRLFTVGVGQVDPVTAARKNYSDTNVEGAIGLPTGQKLMAQYLKVMYVGDALKTSAQMHNMYTTLNQTVFNFGISGKDTYGRWTLTEMFNLPFSQMVDNATMGIPTTLGRCLGIFPLQLPIVLASLTTFNVTLTHTVAPNAALDGDRIIVGLCGALGRLS